VSGVVLLRQVDGGRNELFNFGRSSASGPTYHPEQPVMLPEGSQLSGLFPKISVLKSVSRRVTGLPVVA
jgi:hypothetical protein